MLGAVFWSMEAFESESIFAFHINIYIYIYILFCIYIYVKKTLCTQVCVYKYSACVITVKFEIIFKLTSAGSRSSESLPFPRSRVCVGCGGSGDALVLQPSLPHVFPFSSSGSFTSYSHFSVAQRERRGVGKTQMFAHKLISSLPRWLPSLIYCQCFPSLKQDVLILFWIAFLCWFKN